MMLSFRSATTNEKTAGAVGPAAPAVGGSLLETYSNVD
jgi:hypothetical protein